MTTKERLHAPVDALDEVDADRLLVVALRLGSALAAPEAVAEAANSPESFIGCFRSGRSDISERAEELFRIGREDRGAGAEES